MIYPKLYKTKANKPANSRSSGRNELTYLREANSVFEKVYQVVYQDLHA